MMIRFISTLALFVPLEAKKCRTRCDTPYMRHESECRCVCNPDAVADVCFDGQTLNSETCECEGICSAVRLCEDWKIKDEEAC